MKIFIYDEFAPEDTAMMQALYSRSPKSVEEHVVKVKETGSGKFMEMYYVNYGHASIADCGSTTIFIEDISILADKAIQDWPLYSGQETSTRYIDMANQKLVDPINTFESKLIQNNWMDFYINSQHRIIEHLRSKFPRKENEIETIYEKALKARSFDILRSFLPAGITTQLSWHTNLRQAFDKISLLRHHPLKETREIAETIHNKLKEKYPHSFSHELAEPQENYRQFLNNNYNYYVSDFPEVEFACRTNIKNHELEYYMDIFDSRPERIGLPHFLTELGHVTFDFKLDYGSFRDIQRHRNGVCRMPILTTDLSFNTWYLNQMPDDLQREAINLINNQIKLISKLDCPSTIKQYYIALGFNVACRVTYGLPAALYTIELRSGRMVHPTLRTVAHKMHHALKEKFPDLTLYCDLSLDDWDVRRGLQDITER